MSAIEEYESRIQRCWSLTVIEVKAQPGRPNSSAESVMRSEGERLLKAAPPDTLLVACAADGRSMSSDEFARWLGVQRDRARGVTFVIGGAFGLSKEVRSRAGLSLALAPWTLSHELARLVLAEQLYRAATILAGHPYHK